MSIFQIVSIGILIVFFFYKVNILISGKFSFVELFRVLLTLTTAFFGTLVIMFPAISTNIGNFFGIQRGVDFIMYVVLIYLYLKVEFLSKDLRSLERKVTEFVMQTAVENYPHNKDEE